MKRYLRQVVNLKVSDIDCVKTLDEEGFLENITMQKAVNYEALISYNYCEHK